MTVEALLTFNAILVVALASPGAALLFALKTSITRGSIAGLLTGFGLGTMASLWTLMALLGLDQVFDLFPWTYGALKTAGGLYLVYIGWTTWRNARKPLPDVAPSHGRAFVDGILVNAANPKSVLFAAAVILVVLPQGASWNSMIVITLNQVMVETAFYGVLAFLASTPKVRQGYLSTKTVLDRFAGVVMAALGLRLLMDR
ncbi:MAG: LysE family translocator [Rhodobacteraceae bacterium]|nr:LysE family translocator [Paracoccaceae bacterium]